MPLPVSTEWFIHGIIEKRKLEEYLLSPIHPDGMHKLRLWQSVFGIGEGDADLLERLIRSQLSQASPEEHKLVVTKDDPPRTVRRWELVIPRFRGPNGNEGTVSTAWALDPDKEHPHLTTARPIVGRQRG